MLLLHCEEIILIVFIVRFRPLYRPKNHGLPVVSSAQPVCNQFIKGKPVSVLSKFKPCPAWPII
jgi:hypothetical protein